MQIPEPTQAVQRTPEVDITPNGVCAAPWRAARQRRYSSARASFWAGLVWVLFWLQWAWAAPAGTVIRNQATAIVNGQVYLSNKVETLVQAVCVPSITPNGDPTNPGQHTTTPAGQTAYFSYRLQNLGNQSFSFNLSWLLQNGAPWTPNAVRFYLDTNANVQLDSGEPEVSSILLNMNQEARLIMAVQTPPSASGELLISPVATCPDGTRDENNFSRIRIGSGPALLLEKRVEPRKVQVGDLLTYTLTVVNVGQASLTVRLEDTPNPALQYQAGSATPSEPLQNNGQLIWENLALAPGERMEIRYRMRVLAGAVGELKNIVQASGNAVVSAVASASVQVEQGALAVPHLLLGRVFLDIDKDGRYTAGADLPLPGARVLLSNGWQTLTDAEGRYGFRNLTGGVWEVMLEPASAPFKLLPHPEAQGEGWHHRVRVEGLTYSDFPLEHPTGLASTQRETTLEFGSLKVNKKLLPLPNGIRVVLVLESQEPLHDLTLTDPLPDGGERTFQFDQFQGSQTLTYDLIGTPTTVLYLTDPQARWRYP